MRDLLIRFTILLSLALIASFALHASAAASMVWSTPEEGTTTLTLTPLWQVGGGDVLLGRIGAIEVDDDGNLYALDLQQSQVFVFDRDGEFVRTLGRSGEGPGEVRTPSDLLVLDDGRIAVLQAQPPKIALIDREGLEYDDHPTPSPEDGPRFFNAGAALPEGIALASSGFTSDSSGQFVQLTTLYAIDGEGQEIAQYHRVSAPGIDFSDMSVLETSLDDVSNRWTATTDGRIALAPSFEEYRLEFYDVDGTKVATGVFDFPRNERTEAEKAAAQDRFQMVVNDREVEVHVSDWSRAIDGIVARPDGAIWVRRLDTPVEERAAGRVCRFDEIDAEGRYTREIVLRGPVDLESDALYVRGGRAFVVDADDASENPEVQVTCYELE